VASCSQGADFSAESLDADVGVIGAFTVVNHAGGNHTTERLVQCSYAGAWLWHERNVSHLPPCCVDLDFHLLLRKAKASTAGHQRREIANAKRAAGVMAGDLREQ